MTESHDSLLSRNINMLQISVRQYNCLNKAGIVTIGDLLRLTKADLIRIPEFGPKSLKEVKTALAIEYFFFLLIYGSDLN